MNKNCFLIAIAFTCLVGNANSQSPNWLWAKAIGGTSYDHGRSIVTDASGNVYTTGYFSGTVDFDPGAGTFNLTANGWQDIFISKLDGSGNFVWAKAMGGTTWEYGFSIAIDPAGSGAVYTTGSFEGTVDFDPGAGVFNLTSAGSNDIFISKLDSSGNFVWVKRMGGIDGGSGNSIAIDPAGSGDVYITGGFTGTVDFDPGVGVFNLTSTGGTTFTDIFISKLNSSGNFVWAKAIGGVGSDLGLSIALHPSGSGNVYSTGEFNFIVDFDPGVGVFNLTSAGNTDIFISKLDSSGNFVWAKRMGGTTIDGGLSIATDLAGSGDVYTTGGFDGTVDFDPGAGVFNFTSDGSMDIFISKLDNSGNFVWAKQIGGIYSDIGFSIALDPSGGGDVYTTGNFAETVDFDPGAGVFNLTAASSIYSDIFISKLDGSGNFVWAKAMGGAEIDQGLSIAPDASGNIHVAGYFYSPTISLGTINLTNADNTANTSDIFIAKLEADTVITGNNEIGNFGKGVFVFPNLFTKTTTISFSLSQTGNVTVKIFDVNGRLVSTLADNFFEAGKNELVWNAAEVNAGIYFLQFQSLEFLQTEKLVVAKQ